MKSKRRPRQPDPPNQPLSLRNIEWEMQLVHLAMLRQLRP